jgi:two-component system sensor histidine kinase CreC
VILSVLLAVAVDGGLVWSLLARLSDARTRGLSLRFRLFLAMAGAALVGALATGLYAVLVDPSAIGFAARLASVAPKAFVLASGMLPVLVFGALELGKKLARPVEDVTAIAVRVAQGERPLESPLHGLEARRIGLALASLHREVDRQPGSSATLRDAWHDLKNPLAALRASLELLEEGNLSPAESTRFLANASHAASDLQHQLEARMTLARFDSAALRAPESVTMSGIVRDVVEQARPLAEAQRVELEAVLPVRWQNRDRVPCDAATLRRAFANLVQNACTATPNGSVRVVCDDRASDRVTVDVVNEPAAIPKADRGQLFDRTGSRTGTGLGLAIARAAIEAHGGTVTFLEWGPPRVRVRVALPR